MATTGWVKTAAYADDSIDNAAMGADAVTNAKITDATITAVKLAAHAGAAGYYGASGSNYGACYYG